MTTLSQQEISDQAPDGWQTSQERIEATYELASFAAGGTFLATVAALADEQNHHPDLDLRYPRHVRVQLVSHDAGGVTDRDLTLANAIAEHAESAQASIVEG